MRAAAVPDGGVPPGRGQPRDRAAVPAQLRLALPGHGDGRAGRAGHRRARGGGCARRLSACLPAIVANDNGTGARMYYV